MIDDDEEIADATEVPIEETIQAIARLHSEHHASTTWHQRAVYNLTLWLTRPRFLIALFFALALWVAGNALSLRLGFEAPDPPPYQGLSCLIAVISLFLFVLVLTTQRRDGNLSRRRELLMLELAILSAQKTTKIVALLEELRRDTPTIHDRVDEQANAMAQRADPQTVREAIKEARTEAANS